LEIKKIQESFPGFFLWEKKEYFSLLNLTKPISFQKAAFMSRVLFFILLALFSLQSFGQRRTVTQLPYNPETRRLLTNSLQYLEADFAPGNITLKDGTVISALMNYNILFDEMHFVSAIEGTDREEIKTITNFDALEFISIGRRIFVHQGRQGFMEVLVDGDFKLLKKTRLEVKAENRSRDGYGYLPESAAVTKLSYFDFHSNDFLNAPDREKILEANTILTENYYSLTEDALRVINTRRAIVRLVPRNQRNDLNSFMNNLGGILTNQENLVAVFRYINPNE
jgi:hypothetical protein